jgi:hypothetical protein
VTLRGSEIPLVFTFVRICRRAPLAIGVAAIAAGMLTVACGSSGTTAPTTSTTTTTTTTTTNSAANSGGGHHEKHDSGGGGGAAPADTGAPSTVTVDPSTVTNTETDVQTTVQTSIATSTQTVTATPTYQQRDQYPRNGNNDNRSQFGSQQGH